MLNLLGEKNATPLSPMGKAMSLVNISLILLSQQDYFCAEYENIPPCGDNLLQKSIYPTYFFLSCLSMKNTMNLLLIFSVEL